MIYQIIFSFLILYWLLLIFFFYGRATNPSQFAIDFFVNDLGKRGAATFENVGHLQYNQQGPIKLDFEKTVSDQCFSMCFLKYFTLNQSYLLSLLSLQFSYFCSNPGLGTLELFVIYCDILICACSIPNFLLLLLVTFCCFFLFHSHW